MMSISSLILSAAMIAVSGGGGGDDSAATLTLHWSSVDGGGARLTGGAFELRGTIGQPDAGFHVGGVFDLAGGFHAIGPFTGPPIVGDIDGDGSVGNVDLAILLGAWGTSGGPADLDGDGTVGNTDLAILLGAWSA